MEAMKEN